MKNRVILLCFVACLFICAGNSVSSKKVSGAHPGSTGAPLDLTCAQLGCHSDAQVNYAAVYNNTLIFSSADSTYLPNQPYTITVQVQGSEFNPVSRFGFELVALRDADSLNIGQFTITNPTRTKIINHTQGSDVRFSVTHKAAGTPATSPNFNSWVFNWTAPSFDAGNITFYYATNCSNDNGENTGDRIYLHSFQIKSNASVSLKEYSDVYEIRPYYDAHTNQVVLGYKLPLKAQIKISLYDQIGREIVRTPALNKQAGEQLEKLILPENISQGVYTALIQIDNSTLSKKFAVQKP
jgi:hypothetical protein